MERPASIATMGGWAAARCQQEFLESLKNISKFTLGHIFSGLVSTQPLKKFYNPYKIHHGQLWSKGIDGDRQKSTLGQFNETPKSINLLFPGNPRDNLETHKTIQKCTLEQFYFWMSTFFRVMEIPIKRDNMAQIFQN